MKKLLLLSFFLVSLDGFAQQNLIPNPSFEDTVYCPTTPGDIPALTNWFNCGGTPDYYNSCAGNFTLVSAPSNWVGYQAAYNGNGYLGLATYCTGCVPNREYVGTPLTQQLVIGTKYYASIYLSRADSFPCSCSTNKFGFRFSTIPYSYTNPAPINNFSHIYSDVIITDTLGWEKVSGSFIADSAYQYIMIGNFYEDANTNTLGNCNSGTVAYYFIDQVCLSTDSLQCNVSTGIESQTKHINFSVYPNPSVSTINIDFLQLTKPYDIIIYNSLGQMVFNKQKINTSHSTIDITGISNGVLLLKILYDSQFFYYKLLIQ